MPNTREKLIELLVQSVSNNLTPQISGNKLIIDIAQGNIADHLIANGVTVQEWIPVTERLPEKDTYTLVTTDGVVISAYWHNDRFYGFSAKGIATVGGVTHWMPLPEPPKGE